MTRWLWGGCLAILVIAPMACRADEPRLISLTDLGRTISELRVTPDGRWAVAKMEALRDQPAALQIIDVSDLAKPKLRGLIPIEDKGRISLSADGRLLLLLVAPPPQANGQTGEHVIKAFDLADPDRPKDAWRRNIAAFNVALAPNAAGYAALLPSGRAGTPGQLPARIEVRWLDGSHVDKTIENDDAGFAEPTFSSGGSMLLLNYFAGNLKIYDLRSDHPIPVQQSIYSDVNRYVCPRVLESGNVLVRSAQWPRLEILAPRPELPRIAAIPFDHDYASDIGCADAVKSADSAIYLKGWNDSVVELSLAGADAPAVTRVWSIGADALPAGVDGANHLFAFGGNRLNQFVIYDLDDPIAAKVDWVALRRAHEDALRVYSDRKNVLALSDAQRILEQADVRRALDAPVEGIAPREAAAILNDYGFFIAKPWMARADIVSGRKPPAEFYLRRAIALDPGRAVAYLNLADLLRDDLGDTTDWDKKSAKVAEVEQLYRRYLTLGGTANASITAFLQGDLGKSKPDDICGAIAAYANAGRLKELVSFRPSSAAMGSRRVDFVFSVQGTARVPTMSAFDASTGEPLPELGEIAENEEHLWGGDQLALVAYHGIAQIIHLKDMRHPVSTFLPTGKRACAFRQAVQEQIGPRALEPALCRQLARGKGPMFLDFSKPAAVSTEETQSRYSETETRGMRSFDALNDGKPINVVQLELSSSAGPGCGETFYDVVDETGEHYSTAPAHDRLMALQLADASSCDNAPRFFQYEGRTYFETKPLSWPPNSSFEEYHRVRRAVRDKIVDVCDFAFRTRTTVLPNVPKR